METITYTLKPGHQDSGEYYRVIQEYTDVLVQKAEAVLMPFIHEFTEYLKKYNLETIRAKEEYILELLSFGVLWRSYADTALSVRHAPFITLSRMADWRKKHTHLKTGIDAVRGFLFTLLLLPENTRTQKPGVPSLAQIDSVCRWFESTGEFKEEALRFVRWRAFWHTKPAAELNRIFLAVNSFADYFEKSAAEKLGGYTENVEEFLGRNIKHYRWREDRIQCTRRRSEYHLNMAGAELMNRAFRKEFTQTDKKILLLPGCMRHNNDSSCKAVKVCGGFKCTGCVAGCRVNQMCALGRKMGFEVCIIPHASDLSLWSPRNGIPGRGIVASACLTQLIEGGWELKRYDVPAQCVPLDYCGCRKHWHSEGFPTELNLKELKRILVADE